MQRKRFQGKSSQQSLQLLWHKHLLGKTVGDIQEML